MKFINKHTTQTLEVKQSKFIAHLIPYTDYENILKQLMLSNPKARHFVVAFRYFNKYNQIVEHSSDDGEPNGTSGKPSLMVLQGNMMINSAVIIVRYFGGTKLGTGGLVRAYSDAVNLVISTSELLEYKEEVSKRISFKYSNVGRVEYECLTCGVEIVNKLFEIQVVYEIKASTVNMECFLERVERLLY
ncbi:YigZ family protein [Candidatus Sulfurimonas marisnigri]|uniref:YigZ family protein n=1 Tax=Candidatus Sulfurimonas marisnigri TaxID=2740405 RepID=A0A7S7RPZ9_9BACT|nr:YigZ family protein [Candidatus Sulfurimonas marisnigri]QOY53940.1 YigZ family protein [Candidatus Sulfurimonas marisnigri]